MSTTVVKMEPMQDEASTRSIADSDAMTDTASATATAASASSAAAADSSPAATKVDPALIAAAAGAADGTATRDDYAKTEEGRGIITFPVVCNDGNPDHMIALIGLKNIFSAQLPKMPKEYIVRLVLDRNHRSMCMHQ